jgi:hypothetical protein
MSQSSQVCVYIFLSYRINATQIKYSYLNFEFFSGLTDSFVVHVSSAGITRLERPGLDLSKQPHAVRLNKVLGSILTYKLKV